MSGTEATVGTTEATRPEGETQKDQSLSDSKEVCNVPADTKCFRMACMHLVCFVSVGSRFAMHIACCVIEVSTSNIYDFFVCNGSLSLMRRASVRLEERLFLLSSHSSSRVIAF